jgi:hypothetical protein
MENSTPSELVIAAVKDVVPPSDGGAVKMTVEATVDGERSEVEISIATELAPEVAIALLATTASARAQRDDLPPALEAMAIGVVPSADEDTVRMHMLFQKGSVLPVEVPKPAAEALKVALGVELDDSRPASFHDHRSG